MMPNSINLAPRRIDHHAGNFIITYGLVSLSGMMTGLLCGWVFWG